MVDPERIGEQPVAPEQLAGIYRDYTDWLMLHGTYNIARVDDFGNPTQIGKRGDIMLTNGPPPLMTQPYSHEALSTVVPDVVDQLEIESLEATYMFEHFVWQPGREIYNPANLSFTINKSPESLQSDEIWTIGGVSTGHKFDRDIVINTLPPEPDRKHRSVSAMIERMEEISRLNDMFKNDYMTVAEWQALKKILEHADDLKRITDATR